MMDHEQERYRDEILLQMRQLADELWALVQPRQDELDTFLDPRDEDGEYYENEYDFKDRMKACFFVSEETNEPPARWWAGMVTCLGVMEQREFSVEEEEESDAAAITINGVT